MKTTLLIALFAELIFGLGFIAFHWVWWLFVLYGVNIVATFGCINDYYKKHTKYNPLLVYMVNPINVDERGRRALYFGIDLIISGIFLPCVILIASKTLFATP